MCQHFPLKPVFFILQSYVIISPPLWNNVYVTDCGVPLMFLDLGSERQFDTNWVRNPGFLALCVLSCQLAPVLHYF